MRTKIFLLDMPLVWECNRNMGLIVPPCEVKNELVGLNAHVRPCDDGADCGAANCWVRTGNRGQVRYHPELKIREVPDNGR